MSYGVYKSEWLLLWFYHLIILNFIILLEFIIVFKNILSYMQKKNVAQDTC